ncbi:MAG: hypothetical protein QF629_13095, partial [Alphaproteobacteria bacterium]|nr:hypothetical protein [Alphaproteobacteria bacterium]
MDPEQFEQAKKSYYKTIQGVRYDRALLEAADERISGQGDGRISEKDAEEIVELSKDGGRITETELITLQYISENYHFTPKAAAWFAGKLPDIEQAVDPEQFEQANHLLTQQFPEAEAEAEAETEAEAEAEQKPEQEAEQEPEQKPEQEAEQEPEQEPEPEQVPE